MRRKFNAILSTFILIFLSSQIFLCCATVSGAGMLEKNFNIPAQSWYFILESENLTANSIFTFEWASDAILQGTPITESDYTSMQAMSLLERATYFESLAYKEGTFDTGKVTANEDGEVFFVFFNSLSQAVSLDLTLTENTSSLSPAIIGLLIALATIIFLSIVVYTAIKIRQKMIKEAEEEDELTPQQRYMQM